MKLNLRLLLVTLLFSISSFAQQINKEKGVYVDEKGKKYTGVYIAYYSNGVRQAIYTVKNGKENGTVEFFYPTTEIMEQGSFKNGQKNGKWIRWSDQGNKLAEANYSNGKKDGKWVIWDERGIKRYEMYYTNGEKTGTWIMWDEKGQISNKKEY